MSLFTDHGARFVFELADEGGDAVTYRVAVYGKAVVYRADALLARDGAVRIGAFTREGEGDAPEPAAWMLDTARAFLRTIAAQRREDPEEPFPRKLTRWRAPRT